MFDDPSDVHAAGMQNLTALPDTFAKGTSVTYTKAFADYPANDGWSMSLHIAGKSKLSKLATANGASFVVTLTAADTAGLEPGQYQWVERVTKVADVYDAAKGQLVVTPDLATAAAGDLQSQEEKWLAVVNLALDNRLPNELDSYQILGRTVSLLSPSELMKLRDQLLLRIERKRNGGRLGKNFRTRFTRS